MTTIIITAIISIILWQLVTTIVCLVTNENEEITMRTAMGVWCLVAYAIGMVYRKIKLELSRKYNIYQFYGRVSEGRLENGADKWINNYAMTPEMASQFRMVGENEKPVDYSIKLLRHGKDFKSSPYKGDVLTQEDIENGFRGMSKEFLKKFMERA